jgi:hypothetical protein
MTGASFDRRVPWRGRDSALPVLMFRALFGDSYDLHSRAGLYIAVPRGTPVFTGLSLSEIVRQISDATMSDAAREQP